jgi:hypothetical protein
MKRLLCAFVCTLVVVVTMCGCGNKPTGVGGGASGLFASPKAAVETFIAAGTARDLDRLSQCFADMAEAEFDGFRNKTASPEDVEDLAKFLAGATVTGETINEGENTAVVTVKTGTRDEQIRLTKTPAGWKIVAF